MQISEYLDFKKEHNAYFRGDVNLYNLIKIFCTHICINFLSQSTTVRNSLCHMPSVIKFL